MSIICLTLSVVLFCAIVIGLYEESQAPRDQQTTNQRLASPLPKKKKIGLPIRLKIPSIAVDAAIQHVAVTPSGAMATPDNEMDVGWFRLGPRPGGRGSAVIAGHFDGKNSGDGVFTELNKLRMGDKVFVEDDAGTTRSFVVRESRIYNPGYADEVFNQSDGAHLNLITCDGVWDGDQKSYSQRLVIYTDIAR